MQVIPSHEGYKLLHEGSIALSQVESNGMRIDMAYLENAEKEVGKKINELTAKLKQNRIYKVWKKRYGSETNLQSAQQLGHVLYEELGYNPTFSEKGNYITDEKTLENIPNEWVEEYVAVKKLQKTKSTYLKNIHKETVDGFLHSNYNVNIARSYRLSSDSPNLQNMPIRNPIMGEYIRRCFIPRNDQYVLYEVDYSGIEVSIAACYHKDPNMLEYLKDKKNKDMHRDTACDIFLLPPDNIHKMARYCAKNMFVFPEFYGSYWAQCAPNLWSAIDRFKLVTKNEETSLRKHLAKKGIKELGKIEKGKAPPGKGTFFGHVRKIEEKFWKERFHVYTDWKNRWWSAYLKNGYFESYTGFAYQGVMTRNKVLNLAIQGAASHCCLNAVIEFCKYFKKHKMRSKVINTIHDSIILDVHKKEEEDVKQITRKIMVTDLLKKYPWIITPIEIEAERSETSWYEKKEVVL